MRPLVFITQLLFAAWIVAPAAAETYKMTTNNETGVAKTDEVEN